MKLRFSRLTVAELRQVEVELAERHGFPFSRTIEFTCLCGRHATVTSPPAQLLLLYGSNTASLKPICADCYDAASKNPELRKRLWVKTIEGVDTK